MVNLVLLTGRLGKDPVSKKVGDSEVVNFSLATSEPVKKDGKWTTQPEWHNIVAWGKTATFVGSKLKKGALVSIHGSLHTRNYVPKDSDKKVYITEVKADKVVALEKLAPAEEKVADVVDETPAEELPF